MCGIFGLIAGPESPLSRTDLTSIVEKLFLRSELRGKEAAGLAVLQESGLETYKYSNRARLMLGTEHYRSFFGNFLDSVYAAGADRPFRPVALVGHSRLVTNGIETLNRNNQPVATSATVGVHNGIITNDGALWAAHPELDRVAEIDTEVLFRLLDKYREEDGSEETALRRTFSQLEGSASIAYLTDAGDRLCLATNTGSLYLARNLRARVFILASEAFTLHQVVGEEPLLGLEGRFELDHLAPGQGLEVEVGTVRENRFGLGSEGGAGPTGPGSVRGKNRLPILDRSLSPVDLKRCTRCILPETFPFIEYDEEGVCNYCRAHRDWPIRGQEALIEAVDRYRRQDGGPDCLVSFSGGRDSAFGLHYAKKVLGLNPIAFTYDWGMVTDVARRNQARLCGKLGVEHIIRSPDIRAKRRYIRQNLKAWLKRPDLGMIPLFSAGDKQFYHYGRQLRQETGIRLTIFCGGVELEQTAFKTGFAGVRENAHGQKLNAYTALNKVKFLAYYAGQYLLNPRYINSSIFDTLRSYYSTYVAKDDALYIYHYIPWDEEEIITTLTREYDWEKAPDTDTTWRIDDAFTPFHNYIYYTVAGFSEHDTFRSNQIRKGLITREEALAGIEADNAPRIEAMREYAQLVGINLEEVMLVINSIPKLYDR